MAKPDQDREKIFSDWKTSCMELGPERFKSALGSQLLKDFFNRWLLVFGSFDEITQFKSRTVAVLCIKSKRPELEKKYAGWEDRLGMEFQALLSSLSPSQRADESEDDLYNDEYWKYLDAQTITGLPYRPYSSLVDAWVRHHYTQSVTERYGKSLFCDGVSPRVETEIQRLILEGHRFLSEVRCAYEKHVELHPTHEHLFQEEWYKKYQSTLPAAQAEPLWFRTCREVFPEIFVENDGGGQDE